MTELKFEVGKLYRTRDGDIRRVVFIAAPGHFPIISIYRTSKDFGAAAPVGHTIEGYCRSEEYFCGDDLVGEYFEPREWTIWVKGLQVQEHTAGNAEGTDHSWREQGWEKIRVREVLE